MFANKENIPANTSRWGDAGFHSPSQNESERTCWPDLSKKLEANETSKQMHSPGASTTTTNQDQMAAQACRSLQQHISTHNSLPTLESDFISSKDMAELKNKSKDELIAMIINGQQDIKEYHKRFLQSNKVMNDIPEKVSSLVSALLAKQRYVQKLEKLLFIEHNGAIDDLRVRSELSGHPIYQTSPQRVYTNQKRYLSDRRRLNFEENESSENDSKVSDSDKSEKKEFLMKSVLESYSKRLMACFEKERNEYEEEIGELQKQVNSFASSNSHLINELTKLTVRCSQQDTLLRTIQFGMTQVQSRQNGFNNSALKPRPVKPCTEQSNESNTSESTK